MNQYCISNPPAASSCFNGNTQLQPVNASGGVVTPFSGAAHCDATNRVQIDTDCGAIGEFCYYGASGAPACRAASDCEKCNGIFGFFVDLAANISGTSCSQLAGCVLDNNGYASDTFKAAATSPPATITAQRPRASSC